MSQDNTLLVAIELSLSSWLVAARMPGAEKPRIHKMEGGDAAALLALIGDLRGRASGRSGRPTDVACCFEAGRDGFWLQRLLTAHGVSTYVLEASSNRSVRRSSWAFRLAGGGIPMCADAHHVEAPQERAREMSSRLLSDREHPVTAALRLR